MNIDPTTLSVVKPTRQETRAEVTDAAARAIIDSEAAKRDAKTAKLRAARLKMAAVAKTEKVAVAKKAVRAKAAR